jgi:hypothetical protein
VNARRLVELNDEKKQWEAAARFWRAAGQRARAGSRERERCFLLECCDTNLAAVRELDIQAALERA